MLLQLTYMTGTSTADGASDHRLLAGASLRVGDRIGARYRVGALLRTRGPRASFDGEDTKTGVPVVIEVVVDEAERVDPIAVAFLASARRAAMLEGPNVARVLDAGVTSDGHPYVVSEAIASGSLAAALDAEGSLPTSTAIDIALDVCDALSEAHARRLLHGDLTVDDVHVAFATGTRPMRVKVAGIGTTHAALALRERSSGSSSAGSSSRSGVDAKGAPPASIV